MMTTREGRVAGFESDSILELIREVLHEPRPSPQDLEFVLASLSRATGHEVVWDYLFETLRRRLAAPSEAVWALARGSLGWRPDHSLRLSAEELVGAWENDRTSPAAVACLGALAGRAEIPPVVFFASLAVALTAREDPFDVAEVESLAGSAFVALALCASLPDGLLRAREVCAVTRGAPIWSPREAAQELVSAAGMTSVNDPVLAGVYPRNSGAVFSSLRSSSFFLFSSCCRQARWCS